MNDEQLKNAAIKLCQMREIDPYKPANPINSGIPLWHTQPPEWKMRIDEIKYQFQLNEAIRQAMNGE